MVAVETFVIYDATRVEVSGFDCEPSTELRASGRDLGMLL
jgi:hypothetical protein